MAIVNETKLQVNSVAQNFKIKTYIIVTNFVFFS